MTPFLTGLISTLFIITVIVIYTYATAPVNTLSVSTVVAPSGWCDYGIYCNGQAIPKSEAGVGVTVCGTDKVQYKCEADGTVTGGSWNRLGTACTADMLAKC